MSDTEARDKSSLLHELAETKKEYDKLGGWTSFKNGTWLLEIISRSFKNYYQKANHEYFTEKYPGKDVDFIIKKITLVTAKNAALLGAAVGATVSTDEIVALITGGEGIIGLPANIAIAAASVSAEAIILLKMQLQLVATIAKLYDVPLDPDDPEDILTIIAYAIGGGVANAAGKEGMKIGGKMVGKREFLRVIQAIAKKAGIKILQKTIAKYAVPVASIGIGTSWNYLSIRSISKIARKHLMARKNENVGSDIK